MQSTTPAARWTGTAVLCVLGSIVSALLLAQRIPPPILSADPVQAIHREAEQEDHLPVPENLVAMGPVERYDGETLSDKIDGRAELYLQAGLVSMTARRWARSNDPDSWLELMVYTMASPEAAYAVFSGQRRTGAQPLMLGRDSYLAENAGFLVEGSVYVEAVASRTGLEETIRSALALFDRPSDEPGAEPSELALLPALHQVAGSTALLAEDAFGFDRFDGVYATAYSNGIGNGLLFISRRSSAEEAEGLARAYRDFVLENGGEAMEAPVLGWFGRYEAVSSHGAWLVGVHDGSSAPWVRDQMQSWLGRWAGGTSP